MSRSIAVAVCAVLLAMISAAGAARAYVACPTGATVLPDLTHRTLASAEQIVRARFPHNPSQADSAAATSGYVAAQQPPPCTPMSPQTPIRLFGPMAPAPLPIHAPVFHMAPPPAMAHGPAAPAPLAAMPPPVVHAQAEPPPIEHALAADAVATKANPTGHAPTFSVDEDADVKAQVASEKPLPVVYHRDQTMTVGSPNIYRVEIASKDLQSALAAIAQENGAPVVAAVKIGAEARAILTGDPSQVDITPSNVQDQLVTGDQNVEWTWYVRPKTTGTITLNLAIHNLFMTKAGLQEAAAGPDLQDSITVKSTPQYWFQTLDPIWTALFGSGGIVVIIAGWFGWKRLSGK